MLFAHPYELLQALLTTCPPTSSLCPVRVSRGVVLNSSAWFASVSVPFLKAQIDLLATALGHTDLTVDLLCLGIVTSFFGVLHYVLSLRVCLLFRSVRRRCFFGCLLGRACLLFQCMDTCAMMLPKTFGKAVRETNFQITCEIGLTDFALHWKARRNRQTRCGLCV